MPIKIPNSEDSKDAQEWMDGVMEQQKHKTEEKKPSLWEVLKEIARDLTW